MCLILKNRNCPIPGTHSEINCWIRETDMETKFAQLREQATFLVARAGSGKPKPPV